MNTIADILKKYWKEGDTLYDAGMGEYSYIEVDEYNDDDILVDNEDGEILEFDKDGHMYIRCAAPDDEFFELSKECKLYPAKGEDWSKFSI